MDRYAVTVFVNNTQEIFRNKTWQEAIDIINSFSQNDLNGYSIFKENIR